MELWLLWLLVGYLTIRLVGRYHSLGVGSGFAILVRRRNGIGVEVHVVIQEWRLGGLLRGMAVMIVAVMGWRVAHRPGIGMTLIQGSGICLIPLGSRVVADVCTRPSSSKSRSLCLAGSGSEK